jgi:hypothetical protein
MSMHPHTDGDCAICERPAGECTGNQCMATVKLLGGGALFCHDEQHDGDSHHMQEIESYDVNDPDAGDTYRQSRLIDVFWQYTPQTVGDILDAIKTESESES